jgi:hypothetical protein
MERGGITCARYHSERELIDNEFEARARGAVRANTGLCRS